MEDCLNSLAFQGRHMLLLPSAFGGLSNERLTVDHSLPAKWAAGMPMMIQKGILFPGKDKESHYYYYYPILFAPSTYP